MEASELFPSGRERVQVRERRGRAAYAERGHSPRRVPAPVLAQRPGSRGDDQSWASANAGRITELNDYLNSAGAALEVGRRAMQQLDELRPKLETEQAEFRT